MAIGTEPIVHSIPETAKILKVNRSSIYALVKMGILHCINLGDKKISDREIERFIDKYTEEDVDLDQMIKDWKADRKLEKEKGNIQVLDMKG